MLHYYIYYRIDPNQTLVADAAVRQIQFELASALGVHGRLLKKRDEPALWMEVYEGIADGAVFDNVLAHAEAKSGIENILAGDARRHVERFED